MMVPDTNGVAARLAVGMCGSTGSPAASVMEFRPLRDAAKHATKSACSACIGYLLPWCRFVRRSQFQRRSSAIRRQANAREMRSTARAIDAAAAARKARLSRMASVFTGSPERFSCDLVSHGARGGVDRSPSQQPDDRSNGELNERNE